MKRYKLNSPAKINLTLEIVKKLPNGSYGLRSVMMKTQNLKDEIEITFKERKTGIQIFCSDKSIPTDERNICHKVALKFFEASGKDVGLVIKIKKRIPALTGLGGGSSNGATVLTALNRYFWEPLKLNKLVEISAQVGKDIPFFLLEDRVAYVSGAGEKLRSIKKFPNLNLLIINPKGEIVTGWAYKELDKKMWFMENWQRKNISGRLLKNADNIDKIGGSLYNDFEIVAQKSFPIIVEIKNCLLAFGANGVSITGKGPTVIGIFKDKKDALAVEAIIRKKYPKFFVQIG